MKTKIFQYSGFQKAWDYALAKRREGKLAPAFVYAEPKPAAPAVEPGADDFIFGELGATPEKQEFCDMGWLIIAFPYDQGLTLAGHEAIKANYSISRWIQGEYLALWLADTEIEQAAEIVKKGLGWMSLTNLASRAR